eukprot:TRINITY_DN44189_c0_g1_i1.p1 TRINITY_DN44189_c0_g1~~TRINITY_DN44189_c0_g1_i1.p1  ORF type:complete len:1427 (+),score=242.53 TRINITY_DN44189_c0_g1_i1:73-4353(+)
MRRGAGLKAHVLGAALCLTCCFGAASASSRSLRGAPPAQGLCRVTGVEIDSVTKAICQESEDRCEAYISKGFLLDKTVTTCADYCSVYDLRCIAQYEDDNGCNRRSEYPDCYQSGGMTSDHICICAPTVEQDDRDVKDDAPDVELSSSTTQPFELSSSTTQTFYLPPSTTHTSQLPSSTTQPSEVSSSTTQASPLPSSTTQTFQLPPSTTHTSQLPSSTTQPTELSSSTTTTPASGNLPGVCSANGVVLSAVTREICEDSAEACEVYFKKGETNGKALQSCSDYCGSFNMSCDSQYEDSNGCGRRWKYGNCDEPDASTSDHICRCVLAPVPPDVAEPCRAIWNQKAGQFSCGDRIGWLVSRGFRMSAARERVASQHGNQCGACKETCEEVLNTPAGDFTCGQRIQALVNNAEVPMSERDAKAVVAAAHEECSACVPAPTPAPTPAPPPAPTPLPLAALPEDCREAWEMKAGQFTCGDRIGWLVSTGWGIIAARERVALQHERQCGVCRPTCAEVWPLPAGGSTCGQLIESLTTAEAMSQRDAKLKIATDYEECAECLPPPTPAPTVLIEAVVPEACRAVWDQQAGQFTCGDRISWLTSQGSKIGDARQQVSEQHKRQCGACRKTCQEVWNVSSADVTCGERIASLVESDPSVTERHAMQIVATTHFECSACLPPPASPETQVPQECRKVWNQQAGQFTCGDRIGWLTSHGWSVSGARTRVSEQHARDCGACQVTCNEMWNTVSGSSTCGQRIEDLLKADKALSERDAMTIIASKHDECPACLPSATTPTPQPTPVSIGDGLCAEHGVVASDVTKEVCEDSAKACEVYIKKGLENGRAVSSCRDYCDAFGMGCDSQYEDSNGCRRQWKYGTCDTPDDSTSDHICRCVKQSEASASIPQACKDVWASQAGHFHCGERIEWLLSQGYDLSSARKQVSEQHESECGACRVTCEEVWNATSDGLTCGERIGSLMAAPQFLSEVAAKAKVADAHPACAACDPHGTFEPTPLPTPEVPEAKIPQVCKDVWDRRAGRFSCGDRITWLTLNGMSVSDARRTVSEEHERECGPCRETCDEVRNVSSGDFTCGERIDFLVSYKESPMTEREAMEFVATKHEECAACRPPPTPAPTPAPTPPPPPPPPPVLGSPVRLLTFNVWWKNRRYDAIADLISEVGPDIVSLQEAVPFGGEDKVEMIVEALNRKGPGTWAAANNFDFDAFWCGLTIYRSDYWKAPNWTVAIPVWQNSAVSKERGICGALLERKVDDTKMCVWGGHPGWTGDSSPHWAMDLVSRAGEKMRECAETYSAASVFMCDCNSWHAESIKGALESSTDAEWEIASQSGYDHIYVTANPPSWNGTVFNAYSEAFGQVQHFNAEAVHEGACCVGQQDRACWRNAPMCSEWAYSDHPPVHVDVKIKLPPPAAVEDSDQEVPDE